MYNDDSDNARFESDEENISSLVRRYEDMLHKNKRTYFDIEEFEAIIDHYIWTNNPVDAITATNMADSFFPDSSDLKLRRAEIHILKNEAYNALKVLDLLERIDPSNAQVNIIKAKANIELENMREVNRQFELALNKEPENTADLLIQITDCLIDFANFDLAIKYMKRIYEKDPLNFDVLYKMAYCYERLNDYDNSILFYEKCLDENPFDEGVWHNLGTIYGRKNEYEKAIEAYDYALTINERYEPALYNKANTLVNLERYDEAIEIFNEFLEIEPNNFYAQCTIGECYDKMGHYDIAVQCYKKVVEKDEYFPDAYYGLSVVMLHQELYDDSAMYITRALEIDSENPDYWFTSGELMLKTGHNDDASIAFKKTIEYNPYDIDAWIYLAEIAAEHSMEEATLILKKAYVHNPEASQVCYRLAAMYYHLNDLGNCLYFLEKGVKKEKSFPTEFFKVCPEAESNIRIQELLKQYIIL